MDGLQLHGGQPGQDWTGGHALLGFNDHFPNGLMSMQLYSLVFRHQKNVYMSRLKYISFTKILMNVVEHHKFNLDKE